MIGAETSFALRKETLGNMHPGPIASSASADMGRLTLLQYAPIMLLKQMVYAEAIAIQLSIANPLLQVDSSGHCCALLVAVKRALNVTSLGSMLASPGEQ